MAIGLLDWHSARAYRARTGRRLSTWVPYIVVLSVLTLVGGGALLFTGEIAGWLLVAISSPLIMIRWWYKYELRDVPRASSDKAAGNANVGIDDIIDSEILALLPEQPSPKTIAEALGHTIGGQFFLVRFGVSPGLLRDIVSDDRAQTEAIYKEALAITEQVGPRISAGVLVLALLRQVPESVRSTILGHIQLNEDDIVRGIQWHHHLSEITTSEQQHSDREGGIGRDWSFGWIPYLSKFGLNISRNSTRTRPDLRSETLRQLIDALGEGKQAIALVGKSGVGKTEIVYELADTLLHPDDTIPSSLRYHQVFLLSASRLMSVSGKDGKLGTLVEQLFNEATRAKNVIVCLDNAELFLQDGAGSVDLVATLLPIFEARRIPVIATIDEQRFLQLAQRTPEMVAALRRINVQPTSESDTLKVLEDHVGTLEYKYKVTYMYQAFKQAYALSKRYVYDIAMPGQALSLLESAAEYAEDGLVTLRSVEKAIEATTGVKTATVDDEQERETLLHLEDKIHERMVGQHKAVVAVSDALRRARAGVRNQGRPVGTFLFLGPTGVGKTELAKSLADVYFGGEKNIIRLDMNEFVTSEDVSRLIADGANNANSLTALAIKQPFSVVLLDEIEKAHSSVLTTLLQLLDEGILRDERNREVSFRDTIVIATSNAGSDRIQEYIHRGYALDQFEKEFVDELIGGHVFHPEFLNRFDEIVVFGPLSKEELHIVVDRILASINKNLAPQHIQVTVADDAKDYLVEHGYDPRLGARPLRRIVQKAVESTVASLLLSGDASAGSIVTLTLENVSSAVETKRQADAIIDTNSV